MSCVQLRKYQMQETYLSADIRRLAHQMATRRNGPTEQQTTKVAALKQRLHSTRSAIEDHWSWCEQCNGIETAS